MDSDRDAFWSSIPEKALHPKRVPMLEAMLWIGTPLSAIRVVDVLDGDLTMWEVAHHLEALEELGVVQSGSASWASEDKGRFDVPYQLTALR